jgi:hypothetical protein
MASPLAATVPWMVTIGTHEEGDNANGVYAISSTYRFAGMPTGGRVDDGTGLQYWSWEAGPVHYISVNSFYIIYLPGTRLYDWVVADLAAINYTATPWVVVSLHVSPSKTNSEPRPRQCTLTVNFDTRRQPRSARPNHNPRQLWQLVRAVPLRRHPLLARQQRDVDRAAPEHDGPDGQPLRRDVPEQHQGQVRRAARGRFRPEQPLLARWAPLHRGPRRRVAREPPGLDAGACAVRASARACAAAKLGPVSASPGDFDEEREDRVALFRPHAAPINQLLVPRGAPHL